MFKKNVHSVLALEKPHLDCHHHISSLVGGLGLITASRDVKRPLPHVLESVTVKSTPPSSPTCGRFGFTDNIGGDVDGLVSCTESLGFESSNERQVDDPIKEISINDDDDDRRMRTIMAGTRSGNWRKVGHEKLFPPPLSSLNRTGRPCFLLRPVRKDGRLELFQVRIRRPEILHASREDGRLRLHLIPDENILDDVLKEEEEEEEGRGGGEESQEHEEEEKMAELKQEEAKIEEKSYEREEENVGEWKLAMGTEGLRRCHEMVNHHHHHHLQMCGVSIV